MILIKKIKSITQKRDFPPLFDFYLDLPYPLRMRKKEKPLHRWVIEKEGHKFNCRYDRKSDFVYVNCLSFESGENGALAGNSGPEIIASILASEIIQRKKKS
ncbi:MAG: hypothetical protein L6428_03265 [Candidatus Aminicenantes bacterium]|nr:hypothetical protein [Acidobacteriota bacterium]MCG2810464.1 hypothetical protein [Candidatus Aminicenantes bacterium]